MADLLVYLDQSVLDWMVKGHMALLPGTCGSHTIISVYSSANLDEIERSKGYEDRFLQILTAQNARYLEPVLTSEHHISPRATLHADPPRAIYQRYLDNRVESGGAEDIMMNVIQTLMGYAPSRNIPEQLKQLQHAAQSIAEQALASADDDVPKDLQLKLEGIRKLASEPLPAIDIAAPTVEAMDQHLAGGSRKLKNVRPPGVVRRIWQSMPFEITSSTTVESFFGLTDQGAHSKVEQVSAVYQVLNHLGYFRDRRLARDQIMRSSISDCQHAMHASYCHVFLTRDKAQAMKAQAAYEFLGISTEVCIRESGS